MQRSRLTLALIAFVAVGLCVRLVRLAGFTPVVEVEGVEYTRLAMNLWDHQLYLGVLRGSELMFPPLYPLLIGLVRALGIEVVLAGRIVSLCAGLAAIALGARLATRLAGPRAGLLAAALLALHPGLVLASAAVFSEMTSTAFAFGAALLATAALETHCRRRALLAGLCLGAAYLTRVEMLAIAVMTLGLAAVIAWRGPSERRARRMLVPALMALTFVLSGAGYPHYLWRTTGEVRLQAKSERVFATIGRFANDMDFQTASFELGPDGRELGPWLSPNEAFRPADEAARGTTSFAKLFAYWADNAVQVLLLLLTGKGAISIVFVGIAAWLALQGSRGPPGQALSRTPFLSLWLIAFVLLTIGIGTFYKITLRYFIPLAVPFSIWAAMAAERFLATPQGQRLAPRATPYAALAVLVLLLSVSRGFLTGVREFGEAHAAHRITQELSDELQAFGPPFAVMSQEPRFAFYSGAIWEPLPVTDDPALILRRARERQAAFIVLRYAEDGRELGLADRWWRRGTPLPPGFTLHHEAADTLILRVQSP